jgi:hypothetical protein
MLLHEARAAAPVQFRACLGYAAARLAGAVLIGSERLSIRIRSTGGTGRGLEYLLRFPGYKRRRISRLSLKRRL